MPAEFSDGPEGDPSIDKISCPIIVDESGVELSWDLADRIAVDPQTRVAIRAQKDKRDTDLSLDERLLRSIFDPSLIKLGIEHMPELAKGFHRLVEEDGEILQKLISGDSEAIGFEVQDEETLEEVIVFYRKEKAEALLARDTLLKLLPPKIRRIVIQEML